MLKRTALVIALLLAQPLLAQGIYTDRKWPNPMVVKLTGARPALSPPVVATRDGSRAPGGGSATLRAELMDLGQAASVEVGFQYRRRKGTEERYAPDATPRSVQEAIARRKGRTLWMAR